MKRNLGIIMPVAANPVLGMPLLGKPCRAHVEQALTDAGIACAAQSPTDAEMLRALLANDVTAAVLVNENAPCLNADSYRELLRAVGNRPAAVLLPDMETPLAIAFPSVMLRELPIQGPVSLQRLVETLNAQNIPVKVVHTQGSEAAVAVENAESFSLAWRFLREQLVLRHLRGGVIVLEPERTVIETNVQIGEGTVIHGGNTLQSGTVIGKGCTLYPNNRLDAAVIGDYVTVESSVLLRCKVGDRTTVGPYAYLRPDAEIGEHCRIGDFVEIKNSVIGDGTKVSHLTYVGDSDLGKDINLGCGVVFVNYDGKVKNRSRVDDHAFVGCNCNLVSPVHIGENAYLAAGSTVVEDVPADALFVARSRGVIKENWVKRRKEQGKL